MNRVNHNAAQVLRLLVKELHIPVSMKSIDDEFEKYNNGSNLRVISDILDTWNVTNAAYAINASELIDSDLPIPFIACFPRGDFALITKIHNDHVILSNGRLRDYRLGMNEFNQYYQGTILALQKDEFSGEVDYLLNRRKEVIAQLRIPFLAFCIGAILLIYSWINPLFLSALNFTNLLILATKIIGLSVSVILLIQSVDANNSLVGKICGTDSNKNCNAILSSNAAKITEELSWSEVGFFYFTGTFLALLFNGDNRPLMTLIALLNLVSLPYTFFSIYYQWRIAKQWCLFCCAIQGILWVEFLAFLPLLKGSIALPGLKEYGVSIISILIPTMSWIFLKPHLQRSFQTKTLRTSLYSYKYNKDLFQNLLSNESKYAIPTEESTIVIGNLQATNVITLVSNPYCIHCSQAHMLIEDLLNFRDDVKLQLVFINRLYKKEIDKQIIGHFMALKADEGKLKEAINQWYRSPEKNYDVWKEQYPATDFNIQSDAMDIQQKWCTMVNIESTPTLFINGRRLPKAYQAEDIRYVL